MKEIQVYQSDDGSFVGTKEQVLEYEKNAKLKFLFNSFIEDKDEDREEFWFGEAVRWYAPSNFISYIKQNPDFREFVKIVYNFKD